MDAGVVRAKHPTRLAKPATQHALPTVLPPICSRPANIRTVQESLGHMATTMIYTHVLNKGGHGVASPLDNL